MATRPPTIKKRISSGGVIFRVSENNIEVALVAIRGKRSWCIPKGIIDKGEAPRLPENPGSRISVEFEKRGKITVLMKRFYKLDDSQHPYKPE